MVATLVEAKNLSWQTKAHRLLVSLEPRVTAAPKLAESACVRVFGRVHEKKLQV